MTRSTPFRANVRPHRCINTLSLLVSLIATLSLSPHHYYAANASSSSLRRINNNHKHHNNKHKNGNILDNSGTGEIQPTTSPTNEPTPDYYGESDDPDEESDDPNEEPTDPAEEPTDPEGPTVTAKTAAPTASPTRRLTASPTRNPTGSPTAKPTTAPTSSPTPAPSPRPSIVPSSSPSLPFIEREKNRLKNEEKEIERVAKNTTAEVMAGVIAVLSLIGMLFTAQQLLAKPDGLCASCCRCSLRICSFCIRICCVPCTLICGYKYNGYTGSDPSNKAVFLQAEEYTDDLELT